MRGIIFVFILASGCLSGFSQLLNPKDFDAATKKDREAVVLDVRTQKEYEEGHINNAVNINWMDSSFATKALALNKSKPVYVYCLSGGRSAKAASKLRAEGFTVYELEGGLMKWRAQALPEVQPKGEQNKGLTTQQFSHLITSDKKVLVDFYADWCGPCKRMEGYMKEIDQNMKDDVKVVRINVDENVALAKALGISALPVVLVYENNRLKWQKIGYTSKKEVLQQLK